ncbi:MAG: DUF4271 domain-containing protein [Bacteroidetes bacterium]|jgi:hypothetical protein|nr:DUF4271 domain-containing protein [Bacteroidota bacterium]MBX7129050.1 DUF4271 domain-containing protein [Flavobacteriales bacterium]MCC6654343.1 DUF4271 domain-containing protein [Flavobacteriales bacterium]HMU13789.1 DUF4271 domain-containing protein [Flavobacteriales bacterium]HMW95865.1 DUF4271 domain-containing protein [Flavobacteriales bacterium]
MEGTQRATDALAQDWILVVLLAALGLLGWVNIVSPKKWRLITRSFFSFRLGRQSLRDELNLQDRTFIILLVAASVSVSLFAFQLAMRAGAVPGGPGEWGRFFAVAVALLVVQVLALRLLGLLFQADGGLSEYLYTLLLLHVMLGICLLPLSASIAWPHRIAWRSWALWTGLVVVAAITLFRWIRAVWLGLSEGVPLRYVFIYLCALEILPVGLALHHVLRLIPDPSHPI